VTISEKRVEKEHEGDLNVTAIKVLSITTQLPPNSHGRIRHIAHGQRLAPPANVAASTPLKLTSAVFVTNTAAACMRIAPAIALLGSTPCHRRRRRC
jgi:hypothetical protein